MKAFTFCIISTFLLPAVAEKVRRNSRIQSLNQPNPLHGIKSPQAIEGRLLKLIDEVVDPKMDPKSDDPKLDQKDVAKKGGAPPPKGGENAAPGGLFGAGGAKADGLLSTNALQASSGSMGGPGSVAKAAAVVGGLVGLAAYNF